MPGRPHFKSFDASFQDVATILFTDRLYMLILCGQALNSPHTDSTSSDAQRLTAYRLSMNGESLFPVFRTAAKRVTEIITGTEQWMLKLDFSGLRSYHRYHHGQKIAEKAHAGSSLIDSRIAGGFSWHIVRQRSQG
jgi:hypothetical protein